MRSNTAEKLASAPERTVMIVAGEASSDAHAAKLISELTQLSPGLKVFGMGGAALRSAGVDTVVDSETSASVMGFTEVFSKVGTIVRAFKTLVREAKSRKPSVVILVDYPDFNLRLARKLKRQGIPVFYFISPQLWAWRSGRVKTMKKVVDFVAPIFPFEEAFYRKHNVPAEFVGHPFAERLNQGAGTFDREAFLRVNGLSPDRPVIALLPGSRISEVSMLLEPMILGFRELQIQRPGIQAILPIAGTIQRSWLETKFGSLLDGIKLVDGDAFSVMRGATASIVASGTATIEAAMAGNPFVVVYRLSPISYRIAKLLIRGVKNFAMVNVLANEELVPELLQHEVTPKNIAIELEQFLGDPGKCRALRERFEKLCSKLRSPHARGAGARAAELVNEILEGHRPNSVKRWRR